MLAQIILKEHPVSKIASYPWKLLQCLTLFIIVKLFPTPNPSLHCCTLNLCILSSWLAYQTQAQNTFPIEIQKGTSSERKKKPVWVQCCQNIFQMAYELLILKRNLQNIHGPSHGSENSVWVEDQTTATRLRAVS